MVRGAAIAVTAVPGMYQWAEIASTARGLGVSPAPSAAQARVQGFSCKAFIGLPCPRKTAGSRTLMTLGGGLRLGKQLHRRLVEPRAQRIAVGGARHVADRDLDATARRRGTDRNAGLSRETELASAGGALPFGLRLPGALGG